MSSIVKATVLGLGLVAGAAFAAQAQNAGAVSSLPPGGPSSAGPSVVAPSGPYPGPKLGEWDTKSTPKTYSEVTRSGKYPGPAPGEWDTKSEPVAVPVVPSQRYPGPKTN